MNKVSQLQTRLSVYRAKTRLFRKWMVRSSVAVILREDQGELQVLLIQRAQQEGDPWSGHMAFPGGRMEEQDVNARGTAMRETAEEIGVMLTSQAYAGRLSDVMTLAHGSKKPMVVSPYLFQVNKQPRLVLNHEVAEVVWLPLEFLKDRNNRETMQWEKGGMSINLPCYFYRGKRIWGLTLKMLDELVGLL